MNSNYQQKLKSTSLPEQNYFALFAIKYPAVLEINNTIFQIMSSVHKP